MAAGRQGGTDHFPGGSWHAVKARQSRGAALTLGTGWARLARLALKTTTAASSTVHQHHAQKMKEKEERKRSEINNNGG